MKRYSVSELSKLSGVTIRTLHHYDKIGLLRPADRSEVGYRYYGEGELLRLQQILFYKELGFSLKEIKTVLNDPDFDLVTALEGHRELLKKRRSRIATLLNTIDNTIAYLINDKTTMEPKRLYEGLPKEMGTTVRQEAIEKYGEEAIIKSEQELLQLDKADYVALKEKLEKITLKLFKLRKEEPKSTEVQWLIKHHYDIIRKFWGTEALEDKQASTYSGLGQTYVDDERFTVIDGKPQPEFAQFLQLAMTHFAERYLK
ncbi:MerR family transcriptional regulator [Ulvibacterium sp.]|uniref:MerR family transcriptional regulator n=1 Tax=Ulvibacterium sp. TaxID=2665914 RepID=UPI00262E6929|nr:MerR family transcriptional regulator [Ulvibacterium sp.]